MTTTDRQTRVDEALRRALAYELFAQIFAYPDEARLDSVRESAKEILAVPFSGELTRLAALASQCSREATEPVFVQLTTLSSSPDCPAYETAYSGGDPQHQTQRMADIAGFYRAFGVDATEGGFRPDEISVELDFLGFLCRKEAYAEAHLGAPRANQARKAQRLFLQDHLGRWGREFGKKFSNTAPAGHFYDLAGRTLAWWLDAELANAGVETQPFAEQPRAQWPAPTSHGPEFAGDASFVPLEAMAVR